MLKGWISIYRKLRDSWIWKLNEPFDKRSAWIDLLLRANHKKAQIDIAGSILEVDAGELVTSMDQLSQEWKWSRHKVSNFLNRLEKERHVGTDKGQQKNACKYYKLYNVPTSKRRTGHVPGQQTGQKKDSSGTQTIM